jgi:hypothetical protein
MWHRKPLWSRSVQTMAVPGKPNDIAAIKQSLAEWDEICARKRNELLQSLALAVLDSGEQSPALDQPEPHLYRDLDVKSAMTVCLNRHRDTMDINAMIAELKAGGFAFADGLAERQFLLITASNNRDTFHYDKETGTISRIRGGKKKRN